jgi:hypothetical protein
MMSEQQDILKTGFSAGTKAIDNYDRCCTLFGFKRALRGNFSMMQMLYAKNATPEGYSVWMVAHSNLNESYHKAKESGRKWYNKFVYPDTIKKIWLYPDEYIEDNSTRVCFAKEKNGKYVFQGIYKPIDAGWEDLNTGKIEWIRTFKRISKVYPINGESIENEKEVSAFDKFINIKSKEPEEISHVVDNCQIKARILESNKDTAVNVDISLRPFQKALLGKTIGDTFTLPNVKLTYQIKKILIVD